MPGLMQVLPVTVGPIVGATGNDSVRLWGRGHHEKDASEQPKRCFGVARIRKKGAKQYTAPLFFKMNPNFDMTGIAIFDKLEPETAYEYQMGWFFSDAEMEDLQAGVNLDWDPVDDLKPTGSFKTGSDQNDRPRKFVFGSCRYLLRLFGGSFFEDRGDKTYRSIVRQLDAGVPLDLILMVGDQIYADDLNIVNPDTTIDEYLRRYREVFTQPHFRTMMSRLSTYMTLDDHEIEDNWPAKATQRDWMTRYPPAIQSYQAYQMSHSPLLQVKGQRIIGVPERFWYTFHNGCCDFFVMDCRTERDLEGEETEHQMIGDLQMKSLLDWLDDGSGRVKFVASSVPFFPDYRKHNDDKWSGFPSQRLQILDFIRARKIKRVVFLSGDIHCSMSAELISPSDPDFKVISVISSSFFWPFPHAKRKQFKLEGLLHPIGRDYTLHKAGPVRSTDNFVRVSVGPRTLRVDVFSRKGDLFEDDTKRHQF